MKIKVAAETLRAIYEPEIKRIFRSADIRHQLSRVAFGIVDEVPRVYLKKSGQQHARGIGQVRPRAALDLREIRLADRFAQFFLDGSNNLLLCHRSSQSAKGSLDFAHVSEFGAEFHITNCDIYITDCDICQGGLETPPYWQAKADR